MWEYKLVVTTIDINKLELPKEGFKALEAD
jgi:hypothetical protein